MPAEAQPIGLSDWYELVNSDDLVQGDILENCPVIRPPADLKWPLPPESDTQEFLVGEQDVVILSQTCDLQASQKADMWLVILCPLWKLSESAKANPFLNLSFGKEECRRGHMPGYHMLAACTHEKWSREISIVSFREIWSLPLEMIRHFSRAKGPRPRVKPPYREHLAQAFARYFMRVGLPVDIPPFADAKAERQVIQKLRALEDKSRERVLSLFK